MILNFSNYGTKQETIKQQAKVREVVIGDNEAKEMRGYGSYHLRDRQKRSRYALCYRLLKVAEGTRLGAISSV